MASRFVEQVEKIWYGEIKPGPDEVGFEYSFIFAIKADRVSTVFLQNHSVIALDSSDPIQVSYDHKIGNDPTGREHPGLLKMKCSPGHGTIKPLSMWTYWLHERSKYGEVYR